MSNHIEFDRVEQFRPEGFRNKYVIVSFNTRQHGIFQVRCSGTEVESPRHEPSLEMLTKEEQKYIKHIAILIYRMVYQSTRPQFIK